MHDLGVDRDADRVAEGALGAGHADERRRGAGSPDDRFGDGIELERRDARTDGRLDGIQDVGHQAPGDGHALDLRSALEGHASIVEGHRGTVNGPVGRSRA